MYKNKKVLITGGASGIGKIMAHKLLNAGAIVVIWDVSLKNIELTLKELTPLGTIFANVVDVSNPNSIHITAQEVLGKVGTIDIIINNAGIVVGKSFKDTSIEDIKKVININTNGPMFVTREFLSHMISQGSGHICNIASSAGFVSNPNMSVYAASKWAIVGWSDSLRIELKNTGIKVTTIMPYYINTGMFDGVKSRIPILEPEKVANIILKSIAKGAKIRPIYSWLYRITRLGQALLPISVLDFVMGKLFGIYATMDNFTGRKE